MTHEVDEEAGLDGAGEARRAALAKIAVFGAYTAPAMMAVFTGTRAAAQSGPLPPEGAPSPVEGRPPGDEASKQRSRTRGD